MGAKVDKIIPGFPRVIGGVLVDNPVWLAPMAGITFGSLRRFYGELGAGLVHTEMVSAVGLCHKGRRTKELLSGCDEERPVALQLFGANADDLARGAEIALGLRRFEALEVNMACPMPKVTKRGCGSRLLYDQREAASIVKTLKRFGLPVWSKVRIMPPELSATTADFCGELFAAGADFIFVHGRTAAQRYDGTASRDEVEKVAASFPGLVGGSGDCYTEADFRDYLDRGCAAVLAARGILKDVFMIPKVLKSLGAEIPPEFIEPSPDLQSELLLELGRNIYNTEGQALALMIARRMLAALFKGFPGAAQLRRRGALVRTWQEMENLLLNWEDIPMMPEVEFSKEKFPHGVIGEF